jgi:hypothetical protein
VHGCVTSFSIQKQGNSPEENEDACCPSRNREFTSRALRVAISDGATEGALSRQWAQLLVRTFCKLTTSRATRVIETAQHEWKLFLEGYLRDRAEYRPLQWYEESMLEQGAFASLLGLQIGARETRGGRNPWHAVAMGDSCLFQVRGEDLVAKFPMQHSNEFNSRPLLLPSNPLLFEAALKNVKSESGCWHPGDSFYLATDALSAWFLSQVERRQMPWHVLRDLDTTEEMKPFPEWVADLTRGRQMKNDDVTLLRVDIY